MASDNRVNSDDVLTLSRAIYLHSAIAGCVGVLNTGLSSEISEKLGLVREMDSLTEALVDLFGEAERIVLETQARLGLQQKEE